MEYIFQDIVGHRIQKKKLLILLQKRILPSTILLTGPEGIGKWKIAERIAMALHCKMDNSPCLQCLDCVRIQKGLHPDSVSLHPNANDIILIGSETNKEPNTVRWFLERLSIKSVGTIFTALINGIDKMRPEAQNALLKTIEEPSENRYIFLIAGNVSTVLTTILSRCYIFKFSALYDDEVMEFLRRNNFDHPYNNVIVEMAGGSIATALQLQKDGVMEEIKKALMDFIEQMETGFSPMENFAQALKNVGAVFLLEVLVNVYRKNLLWLLGGRKDESAILNFFGEVFFEEIQKVELAIKTLMYAGIELKRNINLISSIKGLICGMISNIM